MVSPGGGGFLWQEVALTITANLDDTISHKDEIHVIVTEGDNLLIPLSARGTGPTVWCAEDISVVDFGPVFTNRSVGCFWV